MKILTFNLG